MAFNVIIKPIVFLDAEEAVNYYEEQLKGLGKRFYNQFLQSVSTFNRPHTNKAFYIFICKRPC